MFLIVVSYYVGHTVARAAFGRVTTAPLIIAIVDYIALLNQQTNMKRAIFLAAVLIGTFCLGCNSNKSSDESKSSGDSTVTKKDATTSETSKLEGTWEVKREDGQEKSDQVGSLYKFEGQSLTLTNSGFDNPGPVEISDKTFTWTPKMGEKTTYDYSFEGDTMVLQMQGGPQVFRLVKK